MLTGAAVWLLPVSLIVDRPWETVQPSLIAAGAVGALGLGTVIAYLLYYRILRSAGATNLMLATLLGPVWAHILGAVVIGEPVYATSVAGALIIVVGLSIMDGRVLKRLRGGRPGVGRTTVAT
jgi:drug/metabolite transporter (DMT)-like permease